MATDTNINITSASLRGSPSDRIIKPRPRKDSLQSISGSDGNPGRVVKPRARKSPGSGAKRSEPAKRKFICSFSHYGCDVALSSKNEWKRHVSIQHLQLGFYRCDVGSCNPDLNPAIPGHKRVYNDFNRKDLFTQHHRRMHKPDSGPGSGTFPPGNESSKDWRAFEDSLEGVRQRCWVERRKPPQRSTCGFCGKVFEGEGSWNERMEHVGGHFSRDVIEAKEEREDEDLTNWAVKENIIKSGGNDRHVLVDQPPSASERPYITRDREVSMTDAPNPGREVIINHNVIDPNISNQSPYQDQYPPESPLESRRLSNVFPPPSTNGIARFSSTSSGHAAHPTMTFGPTLAPAPGPLAISGMAPALSPRESIPQPPPTPPERRGYNLAPPPLSQGAQRASPTSPGGSGKVAENGSGDRLEDLINQLIKPKGPKTQRRLTWKCDCALSLSVAIDDADDSAIRTLQDISIICSKTNRPYLKSAKGGNHNIVKCDELEGYIWREAKMRADMEFQDVGFGSGGTLQEGKEMDVIEDREQGKLQRGQAIEALERVAEVEGEAEAEKLEEERRMEREQVQLKTSVSPVSRF